jgi:hypothetical protein
MSVPQSPASLQPTAICERTFRTCCLIHDRIVRPKPRGIPDGKTTRLPWGTLSEALENGQAPVLGPHAIFQFSVVLERIEVDAAAFDVFVAQCSKDSCS